MQARTGKAPMFLFLTALAAQVIAEPCLADSPSAGLGIVVTGTAVPVCVIGSVTSASGTNAAYTAGLIAVDAFIDPATALVKEASMHLQIPGAMCNYKTEISLTSKNGGMVSENADGVTAGDFMTVVPYTVAADWNGIKVNLDTSVNKTARAPTNGATIGTLSLDFKTQKSTLPVVKGDFKDTLTVTIGGTM